MSEYHIVSDSALLPPPRDHQRRRSSSPAHYGIRLSSSVTPSQQYSREQNDHCGDTKQRPNDRNNSIPTASTISDCINFASSPASFINSRRYSEAPCPDSQFRSGRRSVFRAAGPQINRRRQSSTLIGVDEDIINQRNLSLNIKPSVSSPLQGFPSFHDNYLGVYRNSLRPMEQTNKISPCERKHSFDVAADSSRPHLADNMQMSGTVSHEPLNLQLVTTAATTSTTAFHGLDTTGKRKAFCGGTTNTMQSPSAARVPGMASPVPEAKHPHSTSLEQKNPFYEVSNEYMRVAGYVQQFNRLFSIKKAKSEGDRGDVEGGGLSSADNYKAAPFGIKDPIGNGVPDKTGKPSTAQGTVYGRLWKEQPNLKRFKFRKQLLMQRTRACNLCLFFAVAGIILTVIEAELTANLIIQKTDFSSKVIRYFIVFTTIILLLFITWYHAIEIKVCVIDSGAHDWRVAITGDRVLQLCIELLVCSVCPFPNNLEIDWIVLKEKYREIKTVKVPLDIVLSIPMFARCYLICRFMALHSRQFQDAATRSIASLNRVTVNFTFVLKTLMHEYPVFVLCSFTFSFWIIMAWLLTQCERYDEIKEDNNYLNALWFIMITFKSVGYGDLVPNTYCGRVLAITTGIVGAAVSSALIAVIGMKLELSRAEKHVNNFMTDSKLTRMRKETAAMVLQQTWFIHKYRRLQSTKDEIKLRFHQRKFLAAINEFRKVKWDQRKLAEQGNALVDLAKLQNDMHTMIWSMQQTLDNLANQMSMLTQHVNHLYELNILQHANFINNAELLKLETAREESSTEHPDKKEN